MNLRSIGCSTLVLSAAAAGIASAQNVREKVAVDVVTVRLTARGPFGKRVEDLKASDLILTVDGKPLAIETFSGPEPEPAVDTAASTPRLEIPAPAPDAGVAARGTAGDDLPLRTMIFIDEVETHVFDRKDVCAELGRYLHALGPANREYRVIRYDGTIHMETAWTRDVRAAAAVVERLGQTGPIQRLPGPGTLSSTLGDGFVSLDWVLLHRDLVAEALLEVLAAFPSSPGKDRLLVVSGGTAMLRKGDLAFGILSGTTSLVQDPVKGDPYFRSKLIAADRAREDQRAAFQIWTRAVNPQKGYELDMDDVVAKALERDVEIVPVFTEALDRGDIDVSGPPGTGGPTVPTAGDGAITPHLAAAAAMIGLASETGAEAVTVGRKASERMAQIEGRAAYQLSFRDPAADHDYHRIALSCRRPGVKIEYRRGYRIPMEEERTLDLVVAGLRDPERLTNPMNVQASQRASTDSKQRPATRLAVEYAPPLEKDPADERPISMVAVGQDPKGNRTEPIAWAGVALREEGSDQFETDVLLNVPPEYLWSVAVKDQPTGLTSYVFVPALPGR